MLEKSVLKITYYIGIYDVVVFRMSMIICPRSLTVREKCKCCTRILRNSIPITFDVVFINIKVNVNTTLVMVKTDIKSRRLKIMVIISDNTIIDDEQLVYMTFVYRLCKTMRFPCIEPVHLVSLLFHDPCTSFNHYCLSDKLQIPNVHRPPYIMQFNYFDIHYQLVGDDRMLIIMARL